MQIVCTKDQNKLYRKAEKADNVGVKVSYFCVAHKSGSNKGATNTTTLPHFRSLLVRQSNSIVAFVLHS